MGIQWVLEALFSFLTRQSKGFGPFCCPAYYRKKAKHRQNVLARPPCMDGLFM